MKQKTGDTGIRSCIAGFLLLMGSAILQQIPERFDVAGLGFEFPVSPVFMLWMAAAVFT